jgi:hypothetical protein
MVILEVIYENIDFYNFENSQKDYIFKAFQRYNSWLECII